MEMTTSVCGAESLNVASAPLCPVCGTPGKKVKPETVQGLVKKEKLPVIMENYALCLSAACDVVYSGHSILRKGDVKVPVWFKETDPSRPICYCAGVTERVILDHIFRGCWKDLKDIQQHTGANTVKECLTKNPAGT